MYPVYMYGNLNIQGNYLVVMLIEIENDHIY